MRYSIATLIIFSVSSCTQHDTGTRGRDTLHQTSTTVVAVSDRTQVETHVDSAYKQKLQNYTYASGKINTGNTSPQELLAFANTLIGVPYKYGSINPAEGFDCSGFITYVFNHFNIAVPRSSVDFTNVQNEVPVKEAKPGDLVLFTGTDSTIREVGHMGIITAVDSDEISFIHSTSGKAHGVTITPLNRYYMGRFVKVIRVFKQS
jgi:cell wall-associated NlpC family hydrolase